MSGEGSVPFHGIPKEYRPSTENVALWVGRTNFATTTTTTTTKPSSNSDDQKKKTVFRCSVLMLMIYQKNTKRSDKGIS